MTSTLDVLHELAAGGAPQGTVVVAQEQVEGRGTRGRTWHSPPGGLWYSILLRQVPESAVESLSLRVGIAVALAAEHTIPGIRLGIKWPNDIMLVDRKVGGVLCEARWQAGVLGWIAVGIGLNVRNPIPPELSAHATTLQGEAGDCAPGDLVLPITDQICALEFSESGLTPDEVAQFSGRDWLQGKRLAQPVAGIARGIRPDGMLQVERTDGVTVAIRAGQLELS